MTRRGTTLFELVLVIVLLGIGMVPLLGTFREAAMASPRSEMQTRAAFLAGEKLEEIYGDRHSPARGYAYLTAGHYLAEVAIAGFPGFQRTTTIGPDTIVDGLTVRQVTVAVSHAECATVTLTTWFAEDSP